jgi:hypothetical protein
MFFAKSGDDLDASISFWRETMVDRSKTLPLSIYLPIDNRELSQSSVDIIAKLVPRMKHFWVTGRYSAHLLHHLLENAPILESLTIRCSNIPNVFPGGSPRLRLLSLYLDVIPLGLSLLRYEGISQLVLEFPRDDRPPVFFWDELHPVLQGLSKTLRTLTLRASIEYEEEDPATSPLPPVEFSQLMVLTVHGDDPETLPGHFLERIRVPSTAQVMVGIWVDFPDPEWRSFTFEGVFDALSSCRHESADLLPRCVSLARGEGTFSFWPVAGLLQIAVWVEHPSFHCLSPVEPPIISVGSIVHDTLDAYEPPCPCPSLAICDFGLPGLSFAQLQTLSLNSTPGSGPLPLVDCFWNDIAQLPSLSRLAVCPPYVTDLVEQLEEDSLAIRSAKDIQDPSTDTTPPQDCPDLTSSPTPSEQHASDSPSRRFKALKTLCFNGRGFEASDSFFTTTSFLGPLGTNIQLRHELGPDSALLCLSFAEWSCVPEEWEEGLSRFVSDAASYGVTIESYDNQEGANQNVVG